MIDFYLKIFVTCLFIFSNLQVLSFAQQNLKSNESVEKSCPTSGQFPEFDRLALKGFVLVRGVINQSGEVIEQSIVYSNSDENLKTFAVDNFQKCIFQVNNFENKISTVLKKYKWNLSKFPVSVSSEQIFRKDNDCDKPQYPEMSKRIEEMGRVFLDYRLDELGYVMAVKIRKSSGFLRLDEQSVMHLIGCRRSLENISQQWRNTSYDWKLY